MSDTTIEIWVLAEVRGGAPTRVTEQLLGAARELAEGGAVAPVAVMLGGDAAVANDLAKLSPTVVHATAEGLEGYEATAHLAALSGLVEQRGAPRALIAAASAAGQELAPRFAARLGAGYASSCTALWWEEGQLAARRPVYGGRAYEEVCPTTGTGVFTLRPGAFAAPALLDAPGAVESVGASAGAASARVVDRQATSAGGVELTEAARVVTGGRGLGEQASFSLVEDLAAALDGAVGASRSVVDAGWRPHDEQVGKSGKTVSPELYVAAGVSGAIHHVLGMNTAKVVVAINTDADALIFQSADYGLVGDASEILPELTRAVTAARSS